MRTARRRTDKVGGSEGGATTNHQALLATGNCWPSHPSGGAARGQAGGG